MPPQRKSISSQNSCGLFCCEKISAIKPEGGCRRTIRVEGWPVVSPETAGGYWTDKSEAVGCRIYFIRNLAVHKNPPQQEQLLGLTGLKSLPKQTQSSRFNYKFNYGVGGASAKTWKRVRGFACVFFADADTAFNLITIKGSEIFVLRTARGVLTLYYNESLLSGRATFTQ